MYFYVYPIISTVYIFLTVLLPLSAQSCLNSCTLPLRTTGQLVIHTNTHFNTHTQTHFFFLLSLSPILLYLSQVELGWTMAWWEGCCLVGLLESGILPKVTSKWRLGESWGLWRCNGLVSLWPEMLSRVMISCRGWKVKNAQLQFILVVFFPFSSLEFDVNMGGLLLRWQQFHGTEVP